MKLLKVVALPYTCHLALQAADQYMDEGERKRLKDKIKWVQEKGIPYPRKRTE